MESKKGRPARNVQRIPAFLTAAVIVILAAGTVIYSGFARSVYEERIIRAAGYLYEESPENAEAMMYALFQSAEGESGLEEGKDALYAMGYTEEGAELLYRESGLPAAAAGAAGVQILLMLAGFFLLFRMEQKRKIIPELEGKIKELSEKAESREKAFVEKERMTQNFIENVAHQIRTPLSCITISLERLGEEMRTGREKEFVEQGLRYASDIEKLLRRLLDIGRLEAGRVVWQKETFCMSDLIADCAGDFALDEQRDGDPGTAEKQENREELRIGKIRITGDMQTEYYGDYEWMREAFSNLLKNALEHSAPEETEVELTRTREGIKIAVRDRGPGFSDADLPYIFDRYYLPERIKKSHVGIGLNLARLVMEQHFGKITARNREGGGAEFIISLPLYTMKEERI